MASVTGDIVACTSCGNCSGSSRTRVSDLARLEEQVLYTEEGDRATGEQGESKYDFVVSFKILTVLGCVIDVLDNLLKCLGC